MEALISSISLFIPLPVIGRDIKDSVELLEWKNEFCIEGAGGEQREVLERLSSSLKPMCVPENFEKVFYFPQVIQNNDLQTLDISSMRNEIFLQFVQPDLGYFIF